ncbi:mechanosensitive ion channel family protein [Dongia sp.]|uniref:mechanosensitive ion channel family protein n=1 Tax=Dongia sp. TaxID=1977262 RepID=UPI0034A225D1
MRASRSFVAFFSFTALLLAIFAWSAHAQTAPEPAPLAEASQKIAQWEKSLKAAEAFLLQEGDLPPPEMAATSQNLSAIVVSAQALRGASQQALQSVSAELQSLGPAPIEGSPPEDSKVATTRASLTKRQAELDGCISQAQLAIVRAQNLAATLGVHEQGQRTAFILKRLPAPLKPTVWVDGWQQMLAAVDDTLAAPQSWWRVIAAEGMEGVVLIGGSLLLGFTLLLAWRLHLFLRRRWGPNPAIEEPSHARRILAAGAMAASDILIPCIFLLALWRIVDWAVPVATDFFTQLVGGGAMNLVAFLLVSGLARATLSPHLPNWRVIPVTPQGAQQIANKVTLLAIMVALFNMIYLMGTKEDPVAADAFTACNAFLRDLVVGSIALSLLRREYWAAPDARLAGIMGLVRRFLIFVACLSPMLSLAGYAYLSEAVLIAVTATLVIVGIAWLLRSVMLESLSLLLGSEVTDEGAAAPGASNAFRLSFWARLLVETVLWLPAFYLLLLSYGLSPSLLNLIINRAVSGVQVGQVTLSLSEIVLALIVLVAGLFIVGRVKRWLSDQVLPTTSFDIGLQNSVAAGFGYVASLIVITLAVVTLGIDLSSVAIIAGALSVGIGFGLKTVVENFVAGILILIERPIKVGDWIVVGGTEGIVKRISVRSTEVETFDNASVIFPNSELISNAVVNWTLRDRVVRIVISMRVVPGSDTKLVRDLLLDCARQQRRVCAEPAPTVLFKKIVDLGLEFELRCFVIDTAYVNQVTSDLNFAIDNSFRAHGVDIAHTASVVRPRLDPTAPAAPVTEATKQPKASGPIAAEE